MRHLRTCALWALPLPPPRGRAFSLGGRSPGRVCPASQPPDPAPSSSVGTFCKKRTFSNGPKGKEICPQTWASLRVGDGDGDPGLGCGLAGFL